METLHFELAAASPAAGSRMTALVGVVASGNLEVLLEREGPPDRCVVEVRDRDKFCGFNGAACVDCTASSKTCSTMTGGCQ